MQTAILIFIGKAIRFRHENIGNAETAWQLKMKRMEWSSTVPCRHRCTDADGDMDLCIGDSAGGLNILGSKRALKNRKYLLKKRNSGLRRVS